MKWTAGHRQRIAFWLVLLCCVGCAPRHGSDKSVPAEITELADLPLTRQATHRGLEAELARIVEERGTPTMMMEYRSAGAGKRKTLRPRLPENENAAQILESLFEPADLLNVKSRLEHLYPSGEFAFAAETLARVADLLKTYDSQRAKFLVALQRPGCDLRWQHTNGMLANTATIDQIRAAARLELLSIAGFLQDDRPTDAVAALAAAFRAAQFLADEPHLIPRLEAVRIRAEASQALRAVVQHPETTRQINTELYELVMQTLETWPADADAWIGERAEGLHTYEMIRQGHLLSILNNEELQRLREIKNFQQTVQHIRQVIDDDELFYLATMRQIIDVSSQPLPTRLTLFADLRTKISEAARESTYPYVAIEILLKQFEKGHRLQAADRANCEGWALALAVASGIEPPQFKLNPLSGKKYWQLKLAGRAVYVRVLDGEDDPLLMVPIRP